MRGGNEWSGDVKQIVNLNSEISRRPAAAWEKTMGTRKHRGCGEKKHRKTSTPKI